jgi:hypothetical protein
MNEEKHLSSEEIDSLLEAIAGESTRTNHIKRYGNGNRFICLQEVQATCSLA